MNTARSAIRLYCSGEGFLHIEGKVILNVKNIEPALLKRAKDGIKRGFGTATFGATNKLLSILAKATGYNDHGYPYVGWGDVAMYFPKAAASDFHEVSGAIEALMHLEGSTRYGARRNEQDLIFRQTAPQMTRDQRKRLRRFIKDQSAKWMIFRQPMLDFLEDDSRQIVWQFDSNYTGEKQS